MVDGIDLSPVLGANPDPAYFSASAAVGSKPAALDGETPLLLRDLVAYLDGAHTPIVYLPSIAKATPEITQTTSIDAALYGRIVSDVRIETVQGEELSDEIARVATVKIEEEI